MSMQMSDKLLYNGKIYNLKSATLADLFSDNPHRSSPLAPLMEANNLQQTFSVSFHSGNMRGYLCDWEIKDGKLFLKAFTSRSPMIYTIDQLLGKSPPAPLPQNEMDTFNETDESEVFADWFSGSIEVKEFDDYNGKINGLCIDISEGIVIGSTPCHVASYYGRPLKNYIED